MVTGFGPLYDLVHKILNVIDKLNDFEIGDTVRMKLGGFDLDSLHKLPDADVKAELIKLKGVGEWTSDIYLLMALLRPDVMPKGDIALHAAWHKLSGEPRPTSDEFLLIAERWRPYRSVAARILWHFYLSERRKPDR